jgi:23S rRNA pseudouridine1911/1915/1917 synthase
MKLKIKVTEPNIGMRLDSFLSHSTSDDISRTSLQKWIKSGNIICLNKELSLKANYKVELDEEYEIQIPIKEKLDLKPVKMEIPILHEEEEFVVIYKPAGIASHGGPGDTQPSLVNGLLFYFHKLSKISGEIRPGIVHRLDKPTSGIMVIAKTDRAHLKLASQFQNREVEKTYFAWLVQTPKLPEGRITSSIARHPTERLKMCISPKGRKSITNYKILKTISSNKGRHYSLAEIQIETGRTHQIRVHFQSLGCPVVGDILYSRSGDEFSKYGLLLFAGSLQFKHPFSKKKLEFSLPLPKNFLEFEKNAIFY